MKISVTSKLIAAARGFSDWRLYDAGIEKTCALPVQPMADRESPPPDLVRIGARAEIERPWHSLDTL